MERCRHGIQVYGVLLMYMGPLEEVSLNHKSLSLAAANQWIFKIATQELYADEIGATYVYDNRHSTHIARGDLFIYLDKRSGGYAFTGHGVVVDVLPRMPTAAEAQTPKVRRIYAAQLGDYVQHSQPLDIRTTSAKGKRNRFLLGISDVNRLGWSQSIARLRPSMFTQIIELAYRYMDVLSDPPDVSDFEIPDTWSFVRTRHGLEWFKQAVLGRQGHRCAFCGTRLAEVLDVAHVSSYSTDVKNRANPANGIGLCAYCHRAFDAGLFKLDYEGALSLVPGTLGDEVMKSHLSNLSNEDRLRLLEDVNKELLYRRFSSTPSS